MTTKTFLKHYSDKFKEEVIRLAAKIVVTQLAKELGLYHSQLYYWRTTFQIKASSTNREIH